MRGAESHPCSGAAIQTEKSRSHRRRGYLGAEGRSGGARSAFPQTNDFVCIATKSIATQLSRHANLDNAVASSILSGFETRLALRGREREMEREGESERRKGEAAFRNEAGRHEA